MSPSARRRAAAIVLALSVLVGWPASIVLPRIEGPWFETVLMFVSMLAISLTCLDVLLTTDVRAEGAGQG